MAEEQNPQRETWIELTLNVVCPTVVLLFLSGEDRLGPELGLIVGLSFPIIHSVRSRWRGERISPLSVLAVMSVMLTGGIGLLKLDASWFAVKEALLPLVMAVFCWGSQYTSYPVVETLLFKMLDEQRILRALETKQRTAILEPLLRRVNVWFVLSFFYSAFVSYFLASYLVTSAAGSVEFNEELGRFTFISFPVVALPMTLAMGFALNGMLTQLEAATELEIDDLLRPGLASKKPAKESS